MRISNVDKLRAIAAFSVLYFHVTNTVNSYPTDLLLRESGKYGHYGVEIFFVISGFIIPYSMWMARYAIKNDLGSFICKRLMRVEPPYIASIIFAITVGFLVNVAYGKDIYVYTLPQVASHLFYLTNFLGYQWVNPVYWTLAIEFQFYFLLAVLYPLVTSPTYRSPLFVMVAVVFLTAGDWAHGTVVYFSPLFVMGVIVALGKVNLLRSRSAFVMLLICFAGSVWKQGYMVAMLGGLTALILLIGKRLPDVPGLQFFGLISYSLYLFHYPVVEKLIRFAKVFGFALQTQIFAICFSLFLATLISWVAYVLVERPSIKAAANIKYVR
jgi:peptidoglycan/LPS O-acetylase OafA/YrhL